MPLYEYECATCGSRFTRLRKVSERYEPTQCPKCSSDRTEPVFSRVSAGEVRCGAASTGFT